MGTRAHVRIFDPKNREIVRIYRQYDGYPTGLGQDVFTALDNGKSQIVNGYRTGDQNPKVFNGMGCLAAYLVGELKKDDATERPTIGNVYLESIEEKPDYIFIEYTYELRPTAAGIQLKAISGESRTLYEGPLFLFDAKKADAKDRENDE